jgi:hypothetical protein
MIKKLKIFGIAVMGSIVSYCIVTSFIQQMSIWQYIAIELIVSIFHLMYNKAKEEANME